ncbi:MAG TPA: hypothetical protein DCQ04_14325 [Actinobacteria bacterium]|nr:hypothetical protein [Actinomycetota bacterium]
MAELRKTHGFPNWSLEHTLVDNQSYFMGKGLGILLSTNDDDSSVATNPSAANLPMPEQLQCFGAFSASHLESPHAIQLHPFEHHGLHDVPLVAR